MLSAKLRKVKQLNPDKSVVPVDGARERWSTIYENNPNVGRLQGRNPGHPEVIPVSIRPRPYIDHIDKASGRFIFKAAHPSPGQVMLTTPEKNWAASMTKNYSPFVYIEPGVKGTVSGDNKSWGWDRYQTVVDRLGEKITFVQGGPAGTRVLKGARFIPTETIRQALSILRCSVAYCGNEGAMHHAAAAFNKPAVVLFGGFISPDCTGYPGHTNLWVPHQDYPHGCGMMTNCQHCRDSMNSISTEEVITALSQAVQPFLK